MCLFLHMQNVVFLMMRLNYYFVVFQLELSPKPPSPVSGLAKNFVPTYNGEENAFSIQLFCIDERYEMR